jgi:hypothetical protein
MEPQMTFGQFAGAALLMLAICIGFAIIVYGDDIIDYLRKKKE